MLRATSVCEKTTPPEKRTQGQISFKNTKSRAGEQFLLQDCMAKDLRKRNILSRTLVAMPNNDNNDNDNEDDNNISTTTTTTATNDTTTTTTNSKHDNDHSNIKILLIIL